MKYACKSQTFATTFARALLGYAGSANGFSTGPPPDARVRMSLIRRVSRVNFDRLATRPRGPSDNPGGQFHAFTSQFASVHGGRRLCARRVHWPIRPRRRRLGCRPRLSPRPADQRRRHARDRPDQLDREPPRAAISPSSPATASSIRTLTPRRRRTAIPACSRRSPAPRRRPAACSTTTATTARNIRPRPSTPAKACLTQAAPGTREPRSPTSRSSTRATITRPHWSPTSPAAAHSVKSTRSSIPTTCSASSSTANARPSIRTNMSEPTPSSR